MRFLRSLVSLATACAVALAAAPSWAEETAAAKAGMPQLDMGFFPGQIFWLAIAFALLYVLMARFALPGVERTQKKRQAAIAVELAAANTAHEAAKKIIAEYEKILADARAQAVRDEDMTPASKDAMARLAEQQKVLAKDMHQAEARIANARDAALREVETAAVDIANSVIEKITGLKLQVKP